MDTATASIVHVAKDTSCKTSCVVERDGSVIGAVVEATRIGVGSNTCKAVVVAWADCQRSAERAVADDGRVAGFTCDTTCMGKTRCGSIDVEGRVNVGNL